MDIPMTVETVGATVTGVTALGAVVMYVVKSELSKFSLQIQQTLSQQQEQNRAWVNGSFMRASVVGAQLDSYESRLESYGSRMEEVERRLDIHIEAQRPQMSADLR